MKLSDYNYATTTHEDEYGAEWECKVHFCYSPAERPDYEDGHMTYPGCAASVEIMAVERNEPIYDVPQWVEFEDYTEEESADWVTEIHELINSQGEDDEH